MFFDKKKKNQKCGFCNSRINQKFSFCPHCGTQLLEKGLERKDYGFLGKNDNIDDIEKSEISKNGGLTDKIVGLVVNNLFKSLTKQLKDLDKQMGPTLENFNGSSEVTPFPNGFKIKINPNMKPKKKTQAKKERKLIPNTEQIGRMSKLPRKTAKSAVKRLSNKVVYELTTPGVQTIKDIFVSELESGYEIKALSPKKVYTSTIPLSLPLRSISLTKNKVLVEFISNSQ